MDRSFGGNCHFYCCAEIWINHDKIRIKLLFQIYFNLKLMLTKFYTDIRHGQAFLGNGHFNCCAEMGELMLIYVRDVSWLIKLSLEWQLRNRFLTKFSKKMTNSLNSVLSLATSLFQDHLVRGCFPKFATDKWPFSDHFWSFFWHLLISQNRSSDGLLEVVNRFIS